jgi:hypothetical protein
MIEHPESTPWGKRCTERARKHGYEIVSASKVYDAFNNTVPPSLPKFAALKESQLAHEVCPDIVHLIKLSALKGGMYTFRWGVSLSYVPHEWDPKPKFHRTLKSARFDLWEDPFEFLITDHDSDEAGDFFIDTLHGEQCMKDDFAKSWSKLRPEITGRLELLTTLEGVLQKGIEHAARKWIGPRHWPYPGIVHAFTLARLGNMSEADSVLRECITENEYFENPEELFNTLRKVHKRETIHG